APCRSSSWSVVSPTTSGPGGRSTTATRRARSRSGSDRWRNWSGSTDSWPSGDGPEEDLQAPHRLTPELLGHRRPRDHCGRRPRLPEDRRRATLDHTPDYRRQRHGQFLSGLGPGVLGGEVEDAVLRALLEGHDDVGALLVGPTGADPFRRGRILGP